MLVTNKAPDFTAPAVLKNGYIDNNFNLYSFIKDKFAVLFFWPMDFTFVCPSELIAFNKRFYDFESRNVKIIGISIDSVFVHSAWRNTPINKGGIGHIRYPMVSDVKHDIIKSYKVEHSNLGVALRGSFLIDQNMIVRHQSINDFPIGRNIDEIIRITDALIFHQNNGYVCPAQWKKDQEGIEPSTEGIARYLSKNLDKL